MADKSKLEIPDFSPGRYIHSKTGNMYFAFGLEIPDFSPGRYIHSKTGNMYFAFGLTYHTEDEEWLVEYMAESGQNKHIRFSRPLKMWAEQVDVAGEKAPRFKPVDLFLD